MAIEREYYGKMFRTVSLTDSEYKELVIASEHWKNIVNSAFKGATLTYRNSLELDCESVGAYIKIVYAERFERTHEDLLAARCDLKTEEK